MCKVMALQGLYLQSEVWEGEVDKIRRHMSLWLNGGVKLELGSCEVISSPIVLCEMSQLRLNYYLHKNNYLKVS